MAPEHILFVALAIVAASVAVWWRFRRSREILDQWAADHGYRVLSARYCWLWRGPFLFRSTEEQSVYEVTVEDQQGRRREGWVRCGSFWLGIFRDEAAVRLKDGGS